MSSNYSTKKITITTTRYYSKQSCIEIEVDEKLVGEELINFLTNNEDLDNKIEDGLAAANLYGDDTKYEYYDEKDLIGGHL